MIAITFQAFTQLNRFITLVSVLSRKKYIFNILFVESLLTYLEQERELLLNSLNEESYLLRANIYIINKFS